MLKKTNFLKINKFNFFKRGFAIHRVGDSKDLELIEKRSLLLKNLSRDCKLVREHNGYINFLQKNQNLEIDDNNGRYINKDNGTDLMFFTMGIFLPLYWTSILINKIRGFHYLSSDEIKYLDYKLLSDGDFIKIINEQNKIEDIEKFKI